jgi:LCP family protein required for cell wall assembly
VAQTAARTASPRIIAGDRSSSLDALIVCFALLTVGIGGYGMYDLVMAPLMPTKTRGANADASRQAGSGLLGSVFGSQGMELCPGQQQVNILVLGTDEKTEGGRADTIMLVMLRKDTKRAGALSIPRDLMVHMEGHGTQKINAVYAFYRRKGTGELMTAKTVERILNVPVDYYIKTDVSKFAQVFDAFGGLDLYVDRDMEYDDSWGGLHINLHKGYQHLNGKQIEGFVRHRHDRRGHFSTDYERNQRQQYVLKELIKQKGHLATVSRLPQIVHAIEDMVRTDMSLPELMALGLLARQVDTTKVISRMVPTHAYMHGAWYAVLEPEATRKVVGEVESAIAGGTIAPDASPERNESIGRGTLDTRPAAKPAAQGTKVSTAKSSTTRSSRSHSTR